MPPSPSGVLLPPVCLLAGGLGSRLGEITKTVPKPLVEVAGEPFLVHQLRLLAHHGAHRVILCVGYLGEMIEERIGDHFGPIEISYSYDGPELLGSLGAIRRALPLLGDRFLYLYGDTYLRIDYADFAIRWEESGRLGAMAVLRNDNSLEPSNVIFSIDEVLLYDKFSRTPEMHWIDYGLGALDARSLSLLTSEESDLSILSTALSHRHQLFGYLATERFYEIGTPATLTETDAILRSIDPAQPT